MAASKELFVTPVFSVGPLTVTSTVVITWVIMLGLVLFSVLATRSLRPVPSRLQAALEGTVEAMYSAVAAVLPEHAQRVFPLIATLWILITAANMVSLVPGVASPTGDLSLTAALAVLVFLAVHAYGIREHGIGKYLVHYLRPNPLLLPFHLVSEVSRTVALAMRLFGNIFSLQMAALLVLLVAGFLVPVPVLLLHVIEALVQSYIFGTLALIYLAGAIQSQESLRSTHDEA